MLVILSLQEKIESERWRRTYVCCLIYLPTSGIAQDVHYLYTKSANLKFLGSGEDELRSRRSRETWSKGCLSAEHQKKEEEISRTVEGLEDMHEDR